MVGHLVLVQGIEVRILVGQLVNKIPFRGDFVLQLPETGHGMSCDKDSKRLPDILVKYRQPILLV